MKKTIKTIQSDKPSYRWRYQITWFIKNHKITLNQDLGESIRQSLSKQCNDLQICLEQLQINKDSICFDLILNTQINMGKTLRIMQKKLARDLTSFYPAEAREFIDLWQSKELVITDNVCADEVEYRLKNVLEHVEEVAYYDLDECLEDKEIEALIAYIKQSDVGLVEWGEQMFLIDKKAIQKQVNLNCFACTQQYKFGCCSGSPCESSAKNMKTLQQNLAAIQKEMLDIDAAHAKQVIAGGGILSTNQMIAAYDERCALLVEHQGVHKCMAHKYALEQQIPIYEICPLSCLMYPLEIIELITDKFKKVILLTSVIDQNFAKKFGRWGSYQSLETELKCLDQKAHDNVFKKEDYKPLYLVNKTLLIHEFGEAIYTGMTQLIN